MQRPGGLDKQGMYGSPTLSMGRLGRGLGWLVPFGPVNHGNEGDLAPL